MSFEPTPKFVAEPTEITPVLNPEQVRRVLDLVTNSEIKAITALLVCSDPYRVWTAKPLDDGLEALREGDPHQTLAKRTGIKAARNGIGLAGFAELKATQDALGRPATGCQIKPELAGAIEATAGLALGWSERNPLLSLTDVSGISAKHARDSKRPPERRQEIYRAILAEPDRQLSKIEIARRIGGSRNTYALLNDMEDQNLLAISRAEDWARPISILGPFSSYRPIEHPITQAVYQVSKELKAAGIKTVIARDLIEAVHLAYPAIPIADIRDEIAKNAGHNRFKSIGPSGTFNDGNRTKVRLNSIYADAISDYMRIVDGLLDPLQQGALLQEGTEITKELMANPERLGALIEKAAGKSRFIGAKDRDWLAVLTQSLAEEERVSISDLRQRLNARGINITENALRIVVTDLGKSSLVDVSISQKDPYYRRPVIHVALKAALDR